MHLLPYLSAWLDGGLSADLSYDPDDRLALRYNPYSGLAAGELIRSARTTLIT